MTIHKWTIKDVAEIIEGMIKAKFSCEIIVEGNRGTGKSTLVYKVFKRLKAPIKPFNPYKDIHYKRENVLKALATLKLSCIFGDEMINVAFNRDFYENEQKEILKALNMYRDSCNVFIGCVPQFSTLDNQFKNIIKIKITVRRRGLAEVHTPIESTYMNDKWDTKNNQKIEAKWSLRGKKPKPQQLTTFRGFLTWNDLTPKQKRIYEKVKQEKRNRVFNEQIGLDEKDDLTFYDRLLNQLLKGELTKKDIFNICSVVGKKYSSVQNYINKQLKDRAIKGTFKDFIKKEEESKNNKKKSFEFS